MTNYFLHLVAAGNEVHAVTASLGLFSAHGSTVHTQNCSEKEVDACFPWSCSSKKEEGGKKGKLESYYLKALIFPLTLLYFEVLH